MWYALKRTVQLNSALVETNALLVERKKRGELEFLSLRRAVLGFSILVGK